MNCRAIFFATVVLLPDSIAAQTMAGDAMADAMDMHDDATFAMIKFDQLERTGGSDASTRWDIDAWYGGDFDKLWFRTEGDRDETTDGRAEIFWDHAFATWWDSQLGVRHDFGGGPQRTWAAFGMRGLAPYWFETEVTLYLADQGRTAARARIENELSITQRLILQPELEANFYGKSDPQRDVRAGLSDADIGLRLRYEIRREFAPYIGVAWTHRFANDIRNQSGTQFVAGLRFWF